MQPFGEESVEPPCRFALEGRGDVAVGVVPQRDLGVSELLLDDFGVDAGGGRGWFRARRTRTALLAA